MNSDLPRLNFLQIQESDIHKRDSFVKYKHIHRILKKAIEEGAYCERCTPKRAIPGRKHLFRCIKVHPEFVILKAIAFGNIWDNVKTTDGVSDKILPKIESLRVAKDAEPEEAVCEMVATQ